MSTQLLTNHLCRLLEDSNQRFITNREWYLLEHTLVNKAQLTLSQQRQAPQQRTLLANLSNRLSFWRNLGGPLCTARHTVTLLLKTAPCMVASTRKDNLSTSPIQRRRHMRSRRLKILTLLKSTQLIEKTCIVTVELP